MWLFAAPAHAATIVVNTASDTLPAVGECQGVAGDCSLRRAVDKAVSGVDSVQIPSSIPSITLVVANGPIAFNKDITIAGAGSGSNTVDGANGTGIFDITGPSTVTISGLTLTHGKAVFGAAIDVDGGHLNIDDVHFDDNTSGGSNTNGFGVLSMTDPDSGAISITDSSFTSNHVGGGGTSGTGFGVLLADPTSSTASVTLVNTSFTGNTVGGGGGPGFGVLNASPTGGLATLDITGGSFSGNTIGAGGGFALGTIDFETGTPGGSVTVKGTTFSGNTLGGGAGGGGNSGSGTGGGIAAQFSAAGTMSVSDSTFTNNTLGGTGASGGNSGFGTGGGIYASFSSTGTFSVSRSTFTDNSLGGSGGGGGNSGSGTGGGIFLSAGGATNVSVDRSAFTGNALGGAGGSGGNAGAGTAGGVYASVGGSGTLSVTNSNFDHNTLGGNGSTGPNSGSGLGGGLFADLSTGGTAIISGNNFTNARAGGDGAVGNNSGDASGGGMFLESAGLTANFTVANNTISGNSAGGAAGAGANAGGGFGAGIEAFVGTYLYLNNTIAGNSAGNTSASTGGILSSNDSTTATTVKNTILSGNIANGASSNCSSPLSSGGHNIESTTPSQCGFGVSGDQLGANPLLGPVAANGGPTLTQQLLPGSPAINGGDNNGCPGTDQRGVPRPQGSCDIGAYESAPPSGTTGGATAVRTTSATLGGSANNPDVVGGSAHFEFGKTKSYGSQTGSQDVGPGSTGAGISQGATKLKPGTTYHFRLVVSNPDGTSFGADKSFKTKARPSLSRLGVSPSSFLAFTGRGPSFAAAKRGATIKYRDSLAATTTFTVQAPRKGFRSGKRCVARKPKHAKAKRCTFYKKVGSFRHRDKAGKNSFRFTGRVKRKPLAVGRYRFEAVARKSGQKSAKLHAKFRIVG